MHRLARALLPVALAAATVLPIPVVTAATYSIRVYNGVDQTITSFKVKDAALQDVKVTGFAPLAPGTSRTITLTLPGQQCEGYVKTRGAKGATAEGKAAFCIMDSGMAIIADRQRGLRYVPWHQYRAMGGDPK